MTLEQVKRQYGLWNINYGDMSFYEVSRRLRTRALPTKYVWVFNSKGENITAMVAFVLGRKTSRSKKCFQAMLASDFDYYASIFLADELYQKNYLNENDIRFHYFLDNGTP